MDPSTVGHMVGTICPTVDGSIVYRHKVCTVSTISNVYMLRLTWITSGTTERSRSENLERFSTAT